MGYENIEKLVLLVLKRKLTFNVMKNFMYILPIYFLSRKLYIHWYEADNLHKFVWDGFGTFFYKQDGITFFASFAFIYVAAYILEIYILPVLVSVFIKPFGKKSDLIMERKLDKMPIGIKRIFNPPFFDKEDQIPFYEHIMFVPIVICLWMAYINTIYSYAILLIVLYYFRILFKYMNTIFNKRNKDLYQ